MAMVTNEEVHSVDTANSALAPAIKNWQMRPPIGNWGVEIEVKGHSFQFHGTPDQIVWEISKILKANDAYESELAVWQYCNDIWCRRDPKRCTLPITWKEPDLASEP